MYPFAFGTSGRNFYARLLQFFLLKLSLFPPGGLHKFLQLLFIAYLLAYF